ncbi:hypothetical protein HDU96_006924 [Phlyctochytrium bullatum]|nr:hypothetical protein HDU96_006924 [Phlyctochytrium bullatum]
MRRPRSCRYIRRLVHAGNPICIIPRSRSLCRMRFSKGVAAAYAALVAYGTVALAYNLEQRFLLLATSEEGLEQARYTLYSYSIPFDALLIDQKGFNGPLPLESAPDCGKYSGIVINGGLVAPYPNGSWLSTLTGEQWNQIYAYQDKYAVRSVLLNEFPGSRGTFPTVRVANEQSPGTGDLHTIRISDPSFATQAGLNPSMGLSTVGLYHVPASISSANGLTTTEFLRFDPLPPAWPTATTAGAVYKFPTGREEMHFYVAFGNWSTTSVTLSHLWVQWTTRSIYNGFRRIYATAQVDDVFLSTEGLDENGKFVVYRSTVNDMIGLRDWQKNFTARLPSGSFFKLEMAFNGNGIMETIRTRFPNHFIDVDPDLSDAPTDWFKPLGTGVTAWPANPFRLWTQTALNNDPLYRFFARTAQRLEFFWCSHTFTHQSLNNNSFSDASREIEFNQQMASATYLGLDNTNVWSRKSMVTPKISGFFNGDALRALVSRGVIAGVGDSSRPKVQNDTNAFWWPMITSVAKNGFDGFIVVPRQSLNIFFNTTNVPYNTALFNEIYFDRLKQIPRRFTEEEIFTAESDRISRLLMSLSWQPYTNLRNADLPPVPVPGTNFSARLGLLQLWCEKVFDAYRKLATWPVISLKQDDLTDRFLERVKYETAGVRVVFEATTNNGTTTATGFTVVAQKECTAPVTLPARFSTAGLTATTSNLRFEKIGSDPLTIWVPLRPNIPVTVKFSTPFRV